MSPLSHRFRVRCFYRPVTLRWSLCVKNALYFLCVFAVQNAFTLHFRRIFTSQSRLHRHYWQAADTREPFAAGVSFQRFQPGVSRHQNVNSAARPLIPACHFSGRNDITDTTDEKLFLNGVMKNAIQFPTVPTTPAATRG